jgi:hypothetical protein
LRGFGVIPEFRILNLGIQLGKSARRDIDVKDASSATRRIA